MQGGLGGFRPGKLKPQQTGGGSGGKITAGGATGDGAAPDAVIKEAEKVGHLGPAAVAEYMRNAGYPQNGAWCGEFAASVISKAGGTPPANPQVASNWRNYGEKVAPGEEKPGDIAVRKQEYHGRLGSGRTGDTGSHVTIYGGAGSGKDKFTGIGGNQGGQTVNPNMRREQYEFFRGKTKTNAAAEAASAAGGKPPPAVSGSDDALLAETSEWVRAKESFTSKNEPDFGQRKIGYGTDPKGRQSITEPEARKEAEDYLKGSLARVKALNPNLSRGQQIALASLDFNTGWTQKGGEKNEALRAALKRGDVDAARKLFGTYTHVGGPQGRELPGLVSRRKEELSIWDRPDKPAAAKMDADGRKLDGDSQVTVNGKGQLDVNVKAPPGTKVAAKGDGLLKDTRVEQQTQMTPASNSKELVGGD